MSAGFFYLKFALFDERVKKWYYVICMKNESFNKMLSTLDTRQAKKKAEADAEYDKMMASLKARDAKKVADERAGWTAAARKRDKSLKDRLDVESHIEDFVESTHLGEADMEEVEDMEVMTTSEMLEQLVGKMRNVTAKLSEEEAIARDIHKMGGQVTKETRDRIKMLDKKQGHLLKMHASVVTPNVMAAAKGVLRGEELLIPKPAEWDALMADEEMYIELKQESVKHPSSIELQTKEAQLREEAEIVEGVLDDMIDDINAKENLKQAKSSALAVEAYAFEADQR